MPRIPRRFKGHEEASAPEQARTDPSAQQLSSGDPLATRSAAPAAAPDSSAATTGDQLTQAAAPVTPATTAEPAEDAGTIDLSAAPPVTPASTAAPSEAESAPGDASGALDGASDATSQSSSTDASATAPTDAGSTDTTVTPPTDTGATSPIPAQAPSADTSAQPTVAADALEAPTVVTTGEPLAAPQQPTAETGEVVAEGDAEQAPVDARPRFRQRTRMRRRLRYLRRLRELAFRDLGGLVFDLHRFGRDRSDLVTAKLEALSNIDRELRTLQDALHERREFTDLREAGIAACPRCGTLHDTDANFCPGCGTSLRTAIVRDASPVIVTAADEPQQPTATGS